MRIIAGKWKRRKIIAPPGKSTRPPSDFIRENIFNILHEQVEGASILDLFAGSGSFGIEALSRGAESCTFVERDAAAVNALRRNIESLDAQDYSTVIQGDVFRTAQSLSKQKTTFDIVFCDPPFAFGKDAAQRKRVVRLIEEILSFNILRTDGVLILRTRKGDPFDSELTNAPYDLRTYSRNEIRLFTNPAV
ncbi:MAG: 16S rRNA (guanine(966)-N(2))-methyltransferase RsmD [Planctomycetota bacterium]|jgi:16S rRNA (guanine966-N2)-methyltransferase